MGRGSLPQAQPGSSSSAVAVEVFRFKESLAEELQRADLVISHAGTAPRLLPAAKGGRWDEISSAHGWLGMLRSTVRVGLFNRLLCFSKEGG